MPSRRFIFIAAALIAAACSDAADRLTSPGDPQSSLGLPNHATADTLQVGATRQLTAALRERRGKTKATPTVWTSSNASVATVTNTGLVTAVAAGSTVIRAANNIEFQQATIVVLASADQGPTAADTTTSAPTGDPATPPADPTTPPVDTTTPPSHGDPAPTAPTGQTPPPAAPADTPSTGSTTPPPAYTSPFAAPALPQSYVNTAPVPVTGTSIVVPAGGNFQAALDAAQPGDEIVLAAGATYSGNFELRNKSGTGWITIRGSAPASSLPAPGTRMTPAYASALPKIVTPNAMSAIATNLGAHHYRFVAVEVTFAPGITSGQALVGVGSNYPLPSTLAEVPHDIVLDRVYVHGHAALSFPRCVTLNGAATAVVDSYIAECHSRTNDSQAIIGWNGPGPFKIVNNYLEGAGENVMFGGGDPSMPDVVPADIEVRRNHFFKPLAWQSEGWVVKNLFELKNARRVLVQGNVFENCWAAAQSSALVWKSVNQYGGAPWSTASDVTFQYNVVRRVNAALNLAGHPEKHPAERAARFRIAHNLFEQVGDSSLVLDEKAGRLWQVNRVLDVEIAHNTGLGTTNGLILVGESVPGGFALRDNVFGGGPGVASANDQGYGTSALEYHVPGWAMDGNVVLASAADSVPFPANNLYAATADSAGLSSDLRVIAAPAAGSVTTDGVAPGADRAAVERETAGVVLPSSDDRVVRRG